MSVLPELSELAQGYPQCTTVTPNYAEPGNRASLLHHLSWDGSDFFGLL